MTSRIVVVDSQGWRFSQEDGEEMRSGYLEDRFDVSAGDAQRSGYDEIYNLNEALLREMCCISSCNESMRESLEPDAFEEEWCLFDEEAIEVGALHELAVDSQNERVCYLGWRTTSARATLFEAMKEFLPETSFTVVTARLQRLVAERLQVDSGREMVCLRVFDPGGLHRAIVRYVVVVSKRGLSYSIVNCPVPTNHIYILHLTTERWGEKVGCVAASALHRVPVLHFLVASGGLLHCLYCSLHLLLYSIRLISSWRTSANGIYP